MTEKNLTPFVKWAGGKKQLISKLNEKMPKNFNKYYEPFIGGGALFLYIKPHNAVINDVNLQLLNIYKHLKIDAQTIINEVNSLDNQNRNKDFYLKMREKYNNKIKNNELDFECASLMIWINKHCFNGLYRVNQKGLFNVPYNNRISGRSIDEENLRAIGNFLNNNNIEIREGDFEKACIDVQKGDFVYFDSPYVPINKTSNFTDYTKDGFSYEDHCRLANLFRKLDSKGVKLMLSNHNVDLIYDLYKDFNIEVVDVRRAINCDASKRVGKEVVITNY